MAGQERIHRSQYKFLGKQKKSKHRNKRCEYHGINFDSLKEMKRYILLLERVRIGEISDLKLQVPFRLHSCGIYVGSYISDFTYNDNKRDKFIVEDVKSKHTAKIPLYRWKKKMVKAEYKIDISEV